MLSIAALPADWGKATIEKALGLYSGIKAAPNAIGGRNNATCSEIGRLINTGLRDDQLSQAAHAYNIANNFPPLSVREVDQILVSSKNFKGRGDFATNAAGKIIANNRENVVLALMGLDITLAFNSFTGKRTINGKLLCDDAVRQAWFDIERKFGFRPNKDFFWEVVQDIAFRNSYDPVCDRFDEAQRKWDGVDRLSKLFVNYFGAEDTPYSRAVSRLFLIAMVKRPRQPGCKFDTMVVLVGSQGCGKSSGVRILAGDDELFADNVPFTASPREVQEAITGRLIVEAGELNGIRKAPQEQLKSFLSRREDSARAAYARVEQTIPRRCVFIGTTNASTFLADCTGNRRFLPLSVGKIDLEALERDREQLIGEAAVAEAAGESIILPSDLWETAAAETERRRSEHPITSKLADVLSETVGRIRSATVWELLNIPLAQQHAMSGAVSNAMQELGWLPMQGRFDGKVARGYSKGDGLGELIAFGGHAVPKNSIPTLRIV